MARSPGPGLWFASAPRMAVLPRSSLSGIPVCVAQHDVPGRRSGLDLRSCQTGWVVNFLHGIGPLSNTGGATADMSGLASNREQSPVAGLTATRIEERKTQCSGDVCHLPAAAGEVHFLALITQGRARRPMQAVDGAQRLRTGKSIERRRRKSRGRLRSYDPSDRPPHRTRLQDRVRTACIQRVGSTPASRRNGKPEAGGPPSAARPTRRTCRD